MAVLLLILKIIGIILLILLGLILLILAVVLFVPVRYQVSGSIGEKTTVRIAVTWLLHAVSWRAAYEEEGFSSQLRIFGIARKGKKPDDGEPGEDDREDDAEEPEERSAADDTLAGGEQKTGSTPADGKKKTDGTLVDRKKKTDGTLADGDHGEAERFDERQEKKVCVGAKEPDPAEYKELEQSNPAARSKRRGGLFRRIWEHIRAFFAGLVRKLRQLRAGIKEAFKKIKDVRTFLTDERHREALPLIFTELKYLLTHFKFRRIRTDLTFSMGDPALTGQVLGGLCMLPFLYRYQVQVYPDFEAENTYVTGTFDIKGRARGLHIAVSAVRLLGKKEFRIWLKWLMHR